jgi:predicted DNA-binding transcriptional regulator AlpA
MGGDSTTRQTCPLPRRGLRRAEAALYVGVSPSKFDQLVNDRRMPKPMHIDGCVIWDLRALDLAFDALTAHDDEANPWD